MKYLTLLILVSSLLLTGCIALKSIDWALGTNFSGSDEVQEPLLPEESAVPPEETLTETEDKYLCETDLDCVCGGQDPETGRCFYGNKEYQEEFVDLDVQCSCRRDRVLLCKENKCQYVEPEKNHTFVAKRTIEKRGTDEKVILTIKSDGIAIRNYFPGRLSGKPETTQRALLEDELTRINTSIQDPEIFDLPRNWQCEDDCPTNFPTTWLYINVGGNEASFSIYYPEELDPQLDTILSVFDDLEERIK
ncbi:hypothetical protein CMO92_00065 [Candidatus Woesearchaeota archaeon]|mgnify:CR=1 FL=1|nr:hypothetical protein [Candidatus Woesearchaeota archaeon]|tara:strand:- start:31 stop:777 length:747 start_codon:yes stop_codon:yes gene_type:complete